LSLIGFSLEEICRGRHKRLSGVADGLLAGLKRGQPQLRGVATFTGRAIIRTG
jgi:hypothetical protein